MQSRRLVGYSVSMVLMTSILLGIGLIGCIPPETPGSLVPPTADQDPDLTSLTITVDEFERAVHYRIFGDSSNPALFIMHGSLSDSRAYLPLQVLSDRYYVVMWDQRGNGLSERVTAQELDYVDMIEEIRAMKELFSPDAPISIMGHSWSAVFVALYLGRYPDEVDQAILVEPFGLKAEYMESVDGILNLSSSGYLDMSFASNSVGFRNHELLDYRCLEMLRSGVRNFFCDIDNPPEWPVWRPGGYALMVWERNIVYAGSYAYDFTRDLFRFTDEVLLVGTSCSPIGYEFQEEYNVAAFPNARVLRIENSGHRLFTEQFDAAVAGFKEYLDEY